MFHFFETICLKDGELQLLGFHQQRMDKTLKKFFPGYELNLNKILTEVQLPKSKNRIKLRIDYGFEITDIQFFDYELRSIEEIKIYPFNSDYSYKYLDRSSLLKNKEGLNENQEILGPMLRSHGAHDEKQHARA